ncbi:MAG TPA: hypothetical protein DDX19_18015 [Rhodopirellula baltica]|uniref:Transmembrane protein n=1 Tax=Rhodopirellula baltica (strain DSM 10527 / NCIMB 13988 / SH1) TaxID=243090 RepID=Q7UIU4_RHOBA|nr:hypothetical protein [Rhodopirellula baltica]CAD77518.1 hypothetical protein-transmembrane prediction [Rhodopirellula baltica SH 1]HBE64601.1 hypothetical protein [Rhodopirellula baltica]
MNQNAWKFAGRKLKSSSERGASSMQTSWFDAVTSLLMAVLLMLTSLVGVLFLLWVLLPEDEIVLNEPVAEITRVSAGGTATVESPFVVPTDQETVDFRTTDLTTSVQSLVSAAEQVTLTESAMNSMVPSGDTESGTIGRSGPDETGDSDADIIPRFKRWQIEWKANDLNEYAAQLDHFGIELGVFGGARPGVDLVNQFASNPQVRYLDDPSEEKRLYFLWTRPSPLQRFEERLLMQAGISTRDRQILKLIPEALEAQLATVELRHAVSKGHDSVEEIARTVFDCVSKSGGYEFRVVSQRYR